MEESFASPPEMVEIYALPIACSALARQQIWTTEPPRLSAKKRRNIHHGASERGHPAAISIVRKSLLRKILCRWRRSFEGTENPPIDLIDQNLAHVMIPLERRWL